MLAERYLNLLILCGVILQGIVGTVLEKDFDESSDLLVRQKRVINRTPGGDIRTSIINAPYIVFIKEFRSQRHCPGTILSLRIVITVATCIQLPNDAYRVYSGTSRLILNGPYKTHRITEVRRLQQLHNYREADGISLIAVNPPFIFNTYTQRINFFEGHLSPGMYGTVSGWGCHDEGNYGTQHPDHLRSITVPIISLQECQHIYLGSFFITNADICTLDQTENQYCGINDAGAPLVIRVGGMNRLVGIHLWNGGVIGRLNPDVFVNLQDLRYKTWITENIHGMQENMRIVP